MSLTKIKRGEFSAAGKRFALLSGMCAGLLAVVPAQAENITLATQQASGSDWNSPNWSDALAASVSALANPDNTYELLPGSRLRTPNNGTDDTFPGKVLTMDGDGVWVNNPAAGNLTVAEMRFKQLATDGAVTFPKLVMNGGQLDTGNDGTVTINGEVDILKNTPFYNDGPNDRGYIVSAFLTGSAGIEYRAYVQPSFMTAYTHNLNIAGNTNTFSGKWNVVIGTLLGSGTNALGTNDINIAGNSALETTYDVNNPHGSLQLSGQFFLHQNDSFRAVTVGSTALTKGIHTFDELTAAFPTNFPASWTPQLGAEDFSSGSGGITVVEDNTTPIVITAPLTNVTAQSATTVTLTLQVTGPVLGSQWYSNNVAIADATGLSYTTLPLTLLNDGVVFKVVATNDVNSVESSSTVHVTAAFLNITLATQQAAGVDWNSPAFWSDGNPASVSALANPLNTYEVLAGARLRSPNNGTDDTFPGSLLKVDGSGIWVNNPGAGDTSTSEIRFKQAGDGRVVFPKLVLNGGQLDTGNDGTITIDGEIDVVKNSNFYNDNVNDRGYVVSALLTGTAGLEYHGYSATALNPDYTHNLNIAGNSNTFSGIWNVVLGTLLGTGTNSLGTNDITVGVNGALETTYDINSPNGDLVLDGAMYLHQNDTFRTVTVGGVALAKGTYTFDQLSTAYANFPASWTAQLGADSFSTGSGGITVLQDLAPLAVTLKNFVASAGSFSFSFASEAGVSYAVESKNSLSDATWQPVQTTAGTGADLTVNDSIGASAARFYRVTVQ